MELKKARTKMFAFVFQAKGSDNNSLQFEIQDSVRSSRKSSKRNSRLGSKFSSGASSDVSGLEGHVNELNIKFTKTVQNVS